MKRLDDLVEVFGRLPGIGKKSAVRIAFDILEKSELEIENMLFTIRDAYSNIKHCPVCGNLTEKEICEICESEKRNKDVICIVEGVRDIIAFEKSETYNGLYHVLGGKIDPLNGVTIEDLNISKLLLRIENMQKEIEDLRTQIRFYKSF